MSTIRYENDEGVCIDGLQTAPCSELACEWCTIERPAFFRAPIARIPGRGPRGIIAVFVLNEQHSRQRDYYIG